MLNNYTPERTFIFGTTGDIHEHLKRERYQLALLR